MSVPRHEGDPAPVGLASESRSVEVLSSSVVMDFATWVDDYQRSLLAFAQLVAGDAYTAEDLVQTALARAYLKWSTIGAPGQHPLGYVHRIIVNENASLWRRAWKRRERSTASVPDRASAEGAGYDQTWAMVQTLPARQRSVIALRYYADLSVAQTAEAMGCSAGAVKTHTSRAMAKLKLALAERGAS
jgi:RNA polymerase sigma-70 factor (sigma-E family)